MGTVFLDLDGTLTDPFPGITRSIRHAIERLGRTAPPEAELAWCIGPPLRASFAALVGEADADRALGFYRERFGEVGLYENRVHDGVPEMLATLRAGGARLHLATSKPHVYARRICEHFGLMPLIDGVFGAELDGTRTDKTELLAHALAATGAGASAMLGDREHDMIGARNTGAAAVGALWGFGSRAELEAAGAAALATTPAEAAVLLLDAIAVADRPRGALSGPA